MSHGLPTTDTKPVAVPLGPDSERAHLHRSRQADAEVSQPMPHAVQLHAAAGLHES